MASLGNFHPYYAHDTLYTRNVVANIVESTTTVTEGDTVVNGKSYLNGDTYIGSDVVSVDTTNNLVGINKAVPTQELDVVGDANISATLYTGSDTTLGNGVVTVKQATGRVGINKASPTLALDVVGSGNVTTDLGIGGALTVTGAITSATYSVLKYKTALVNISNNVTYNFEFFPRIVWLQWFEVDSTAQQPAVRFCTSASAGITSGYLSNTMFGSTGGTSNTGAIPVWYQSISGTTHGMITFSYFSSAGGNYMWHYNGMSTLDGTAGATIISGRHKLGTNTVDGLLFFNVGSAGYAKISYIG
jgi:hypothetical protein